MSPVCLSVLTLTERVKGACMCCLVTNEPKRTKRTKRKADILLRGTFAHSTLDVLQFFRAMDTDAQREKRQKEMLHVERK